MSAAGGPPGRMRPRAQAMPDAGLAGTGFFSGALRRRVRHGECAAFVAAVFLVRVVERLEECFLLMRVVLVGLGLRQVRDGVVRHHGLLEVWIGGRSQSAHSWDR